MNEGHSALLGLELMRRYTYSPEEVRPGESRFDIPRVRDLCSFTTHTPVEAGHDRFPYELVQRVLDNDFDIQVIKSLAGVDSLNMTRLGAEPERIRQRRREEACRSVERDVPRLQGPRDHQRRAPDHLDQREFPPAL